MISDSDQQDSFVKQSISDLQGILNKTNNALEFNWQMKQALLDIDKEFLIEKLRKDQFLKVSDELQKLKETKPESIR